MARDQTLVHLYNAHMVPFPSGLGGEVIEGAEVVDLDAGISGTASVYVNHTRPLTGDHRAGLKEYLADLETIEAQRPDDYAREYFGRLRDLARHLLLTR